MRRLLGVGSLSGLAAGVAAVLFLATAGRAPMRDAIDLAESRSPGSGGGARHEDLFGRGVQELGGAVGLIVFGLALGIVFAVVLAAVGSRLPARTPLAAAVQLGSAGFVTVVLVPFLKYPANPPAVGDPGTINERTLLYFAALGLSILLTLAAWRFHRGSGLSPVSRAWAAAAGYGAGLAVIFLALPGNPDPIDAPVDLVWRFRLASLGGLAAAWAVLALVAGTLLQRWPAPDGRSQLAGPDSPQVSR